MPVPMPPLNDLTLAGTPTLDARWCEWCDGELPKVFTPVRCSHCGGPNGPIAPLLTIPPIEEESEPIKRVSKKQDEVGKLLKQYARLNEEWQSSGRHACGEGPVGCSFWGWIGKMFVRESGWHLYKDLDWTVVDVGGSGWGAWYTLRVCEKCGMPDIRKEGGYI